MPEPSFHPANDIDDATDAAARAWVIAVAEDPAVCVERDRWRAADASHERAWREAARIWDQASLLATLSRPEWRSEIARLSEPRGVRTGWMAVAAALLLAVGGSRYAAPLEITAETRGAEIRKLALRDGSRVTLAGRSAVAIRYEPAQRRVVLDHGRAYFEVAHDTGRPFTVLAGDAEIRVTGTKFDVSRVGDDVRIAVSEGRVELRRRGVLSIFTPTAPERVLTAGLQAELAPEATAFSPETPASAVPGAWRGGRLYYQDAELAEVVADLQHYSAVPVRIADPATARLRITTSFRTDQIAPFLADLQAMLPIRQRRTADGGIVLEARGS